MSLTSPSKSPVASDPNRYRPTRRRPGGWNAGTMVSMNDVDAPPEQELLASARRGDSAAFERLVASYRGELYAHCYRMLGSVQDAEDALQESLLGAWRGMAGFEGRSSLRAWLYRVSTNACLRLIARRPRRVLSVDHGPPRRDTDDLGEPVAGPVWLEPWPDEVPASEPGDTDPAASYLRRESVELAFVAALQHLPGTQRAVLILREVLEFSAAEVARILDTTPASVNSALQRARKAVDQRVPRPAQQAELDALGADGRRELVDAFATPWRLVPIRANGQLAFACYQGDPDGDRFRLGAINVLSLRAGRIVELAGFLDPGVHRHFGLPKEPPDGVDRRSER